VKIEKRPLMLIEAEKNNTSYSIIVQNIDKIHLIKPNGNPISIAEVKKGDTVLAYLLDSKGRHFGETVDEFIVER
jgi:3-dehydroquinate synthase II